MSKYKVGDKFVIEIKARQYVPFEGAKYYINGFNTLVFDDNGLDRLERYEAKQSEIKVGDEVKIDNDSIGVVTSIWDDRVSGVITVGGEEGKQGYVFNLIDKSRYVKTGRHYDIDSILEQLKGADDE